MGLYASTALGEFRLKCTNCSFEMVHVTGVKTLQLGDHPGNYMCPKCKRSDTVITIEVPTVYNKYPTL